MRCGARRNGQVARLLLQLVQVVAYIVCDLGPVVEALTARLALGHLASRAAIASITIEARYALDTFAVAGHLVALLRLGTSLVTSATLFILHLSVE